MGRSYLLAATVALAVAFVGTDAAALSEAPRSPAMVRKDIDQAIIDALEKLRKEMHTGDSSLGIPPLDPFKTSRLDFDINEDIAVAKGYLKDLAITHLSEFKTNAIKNDLKNLKAFFNVTFPTIMFTGHYNVTGKVLGSVKVFGDGDFWLTLTKLATWGNVTLDSKDGSQDSTVVIKTLGIDFSLGDMKANFKNLMGGGSQGDTVNAIINENGVQLVTQEKHPLATFIQKTVIDFANKQLSKYTLRQLLKILGVEG